MNKKKRHEIFLRFREHNPYLSIGLKFNSPFELLISVLLSAQTTDISVNKATENLYLIANTPSSILKLGVEGVINYIRTIGLFNRKARYIIKTCNILLNKFQGKVPESREALEALPGIGRKSANIILNTVFGWPTIAVDSHIFRVCNRTNLAPGKNVKQVEEKLLNVVPKQFKIDCHNYLIAHGRHTCIARKPRCQFCLIKDLCEYNNKTIDL